MAVADGESENEAEIENEDVSSAEAVEIIADEAERAEEKKDTSNSGKNNQKKK